MAEYNVIREFILIRSVIWEVLDQGRSDIAYDIDNAFREVVRIELFQDLGHLSMPEFLSQFLIDPFVSIDRQLPVLIGNVDEDAISVRRFLHFELSKNLCRPVHGVHKAATLFNEDTDLAAGPHLLFTYCINDLLLVVVTEEVVSLSAKGEESQA